MPILFMFALAAVWVALRMPPAYGVFAVTQVLLAARQGWFLHLFVSVPRYLIVVFPCYFAFATLLASRRGLQVVWFSPLGYLPGRVVSLCRLRGSSSAERRRGNMATSVSAQSFTGNGAPLQHCVIDSSSPSVGSNLTYRGGVIVIPLQPLMQGVQYVVALTVNGIPARRSRPSRA